MADKTKATTFLMFDDHAEEAIKLYTSLFEDGEIIDIERYGPDGPGREGTVERAAFSFGGLVLMATDSTVSHEIGHNPYLSIYVECESDDEMQRLYETLSKDGKIPMPLDSYGFSTKFAWVTDRYGIPWQLSLNPPIGWCG
jgi:predicted 3-demethylubiquinone-9 3-methyltransferase (glyoxalase superfamily)